jgi:hypothetical protein
MVVLIIYGIINHGNEENNGLKGDKMKKIKLILILCVFIGIIIVYNNINNANKAYMESVNVALKGELESYMNKIKIVMDNEKYTLQLIDVNLGENISTYKKETHANANVTFNVYDEKGAVRFENVGYYFSIRRNTPNEIFNIDSIIDNRFFSSIESEVIHKYVEELHKSLKEQSSDNNREEFVNLSGEGNPRWTYEINDGKVIKPGEYTCEWKYFLNEFSLYTKSQIYVESLDLENILTINTKLVDKNKSPLIFMKSEDISKISLEKETDVVIKDEQLIKEFLQYLNELKFKSYSKQQNLKEEGMTILIYSKNGNIDYLNIDEDNIYGNHRFSACHGKEFVEGLKEILYREP